VRDHPQLTLLAAAGVRLGLDRIGSLLGWLGSPQATFRMVHVGGTNGKGGASAVIDAALRAQGLKVGRYTSPHLQHVNERIVIDGRAISDEELSALLEEVTLEAHRWAEAQASDLSEEALLLTYYEALTACAFLYFCRREVDVAVVEVGLGGRLDATRTGRAVATAIVTVGLDHCEVLGPDLASVAFEKAGIFRRGRPAVVGRLPPDALRVVRSQAAALEAPAFLCDEDWSVEGTPEDFRFRMGEVDWSGLSVALHGAHQVHNCGVALATLVALGQAAPDLAVSESAVRLALTRVRHPGRCEWLASDLLVDGAHNVEGAQALADYLRGLPRDRPRTLLFGMSEGKDVRAVVAALGPQVDRILTTACSHPRAISPGAVAEALVDFSVPVMPAGPVEEALPLGRQCDGLLVVAGSLFLVGAVRDLMTP